MRSIMVYVVNVDTIGLRSCGGRSAEMPRADGFTEDAPFGNKRRW
jgi:hypothetical protein